MFKRTLFLAALAVFAGPTDTAHGGGKNVAIIDYSNEQALAQAWCFLLTDNGHACTVFPSEGPTGPLDPFDVVIDLSLDWSDPTGMLADCMRAGKTVITWYVAPAVLGVRTNPTVQAWIGATWDLQPSGALYSTALDPILGSVPVGTYLATCADGPCAGLTDAPGHPFAKVLARFEWPFPQPPPAPIGIMRNYWEGGVSVYLANVIGPYTPSTNWIVLNAVEARNIIPTLNGWGLLALALGIGAAGMIVIQRRRSSTRSGLTLPAMFMGYLIAASAPLQADVTTTQENGVTFLRIADGEPFHSTDKTVANLRSVAIPNSAGVAVLWDEISVTAVREPFYAVSLDGTNVDEVSATSYDLQLRYARFDPAVGQPAILTSLLAPADGELYIVQFVTQSLSAFRAGVEVQGATIYDFLPNHAHIAKLPPQARVAVEALPFVRAVVPYHPAYRLEPFLRDNLDRAEQLFPLQRYNIRVFAPGQKPVVAAHIAAMGGLVDSADTGKRTLVATLTPAQLLQVVRWDEVLFVNRWGPMEPDMDIVRRMPLLPNGSDGGANYLQAVAGYRGSGVRGEVFDVGFNTSHQDFGSPVVGELVCPVAREWPIEHGAPVGNAWHGACTSGIIFGNGTGNPNARGLLPCGQTIVATWNNLGFSGGNRYWHTCELVQCACCPTDPPDPNCTPDPNCPYEAVFQSTSGGSPETLDYDPDMDDILFDFDLVHCQSQGNLGDVTDLEDSRYSRPQAWAKNTISVGGVYHFGNTNPYDDRWYSTAWWLQPDQDKGASIGPAKDGRVKPDLCHFFDQILTTGAGWPLPEYEPYFWGTSSATPIVCGHVGLLMEMWADDADADGKNIFGVPVVSCNPATENCVFKRRPHMTLPKAMLINTAKQYSWTNPAYNPSLDRNKQGWGLPNIAAVYDLRQKMVIVNETDVITQFQSIVYNVLVNADEPSLKVTLVYADPPGAPSSSRHSNNDLTLKVTAPNGTTHYWGNCGLRDGLWSSPDCTSGDHPYPSNPTIEVIDTVENVFVQNPPQGLWQIRVRADEINQDGHTETPAGAGCSIAPFCDVDFALVVSGALRDCNANGIPDEQDIASGTSPDCNGNVVPDECESIIGACCIGGTCSVVAQTCCSSQGGVFFGEGVTCDVCNVCEAGSSACCLPGGQCILWTEECCLAVGGGFFPRENQCTNVYCAILAPVPGP